MTVYPSLRLWGACIFALTLCVCAWPALADEPKTKPAAEVTPRQKELVNKLFDVTGAKKQYETSLTAGFDSAMAAQAKQLPAAQRKKIDRAMAKVKTLMLDEMGWDKVKDEMVAIYANHFSDDEMEQAIKALDNPGARVYIEKQITLLPKTMAFAQGRSQALTPKIMQIVQAEMFAPENPGLEPAVPEGGPAPAPAPAP